MAGSAKLIATIASIAALLSGALPSVAWSRSADQSSGSIASDRRCRGNHALVDKCFTVHGRIFTANGTPDVRIWPVGTKRHLGVLPPEREILPPCLRGQFGFAVRAEIYGDFTVCPFTHNRSGEMRMVCVEEARHLVVEHFPTEQNASNTYSRLEGCSLMGASAAE